MIKTGKVEAGKTPSEVSGLKSQTIKNGTALRLNETPGEGERKLMAKLRELDNLDIVDEDTIPTR